MNTNLQSTLQAIVLAGGRSTRFNTGRTKLLEKICGRPMLLYITKRLEHMAIPTTLLVGHQRESIQDLINAEHGNSIKFIVQNEQQGTGHALLCTRSAWNSSTILILNGDVPLITSEILEHAYKSHQESKAVITFVAAHHEDPSVGDYGRIVQQGSQVKIVESKDFKGNAQEYCWLNAGIYFIEQTFLREAIERLENNNAAQEFYITDLIGYASTYHSVNMVKAPFDRVRGINTLKELWMVEQIQRSEIIAHWMEQGIRFDTVQTVRIDWDVIIGAGTSIGTGVDLGAGTKLGNNCIIGCYSVLSGATLGNEVIIKPHTMITDSVIEDRAQVGPFAHVESSSHIGQEAVVGNFVHIKRSHLGSRSKAKHLAFLGDALIGARVNIGGGTITCNYDGKNKNQTNIEDNAFIGSNNTLVAPLIIEKNSYTAAGSTITKSVVAGSLALGRAHQINKLGYAQKLRAHPSEPSTDLDCYESDSATVQFQGALTVDSSLLEME